MSEIKDDSAADCNRDDSLARRSSTITVPLLNIVLAVAYTTYGMSCATPDKLRHILCSHLILMKYVMPRIFSGHTAILQMFLSAPTSTS